MTSNKLLLLLAAVLCVIPCQSSLAEWRLVYQSNQHGKTLAGNKQTLFQAIRTGSPIRIYWKVSRVNNPTSFVEHVIIPEFITNANDQEVFAQTPEHIAQTSYWDTELQDFSSATVVWRRGLLSTTGGFMAVWYNRATGQVIRKLPQKANISWFADINSQYSFNNSEELP